MFVDRARINVTAGAGGNGCVSFRREKYVPRGGPNGGDGGDGGDIVLEATTRLNALNHLRYHSTWKGKRGEHGQGSDMHGKRGEDVVIDVPVGTVVKSSETGEVLADLAEEGARYVAAHGGKGGRGNARFVTSINRAPRFAEKGEPGEQAHLEFELKLIADVGVVGLPNAGKSTLLARITAAKPKIGDYPFTTISPNLGVVELSDYRTFTVADIPGIIEGAADGKGLGHDFLRHIERTKVLLYLIDPTFEDPESTLQTLEQELKSHQPGLVERPRVLAFSKADLPEARERYARRSDVFAAAHLVSAATGEGVNDLLEALWAALERYEQEQRGIAFAEAPVKEYTYEPPFTIRREADGFSVEGRKVERAVRMTDFANNEAVRHLDRTLRKMGLYRALQKLGAAEGETIYIHDVELEYHAE